MKKKDNDQVPIDIILYFTVKYLPSPINKNIKLFLGAQLTSTFSKNDLNNEKKKQQRDLAQKAGEITSKKFNIQIL